MRRVPVREQVEFADCGAACLAMTLGLRGRYVPLEELRLDLGAGRDGTDALRMIETARKHGLRGRGVRGELEDLKLLDAGTILFWDLNHFVVLEKAGRRGVAVVDPAYGRRLISWDDADRSYSGVAITFEPGDDFHLGGSTRRSGGRYLNALLRERSDLFRVVATSVLLRVVALALPLLIAVIVDSVVPDGDRSLLGVVMASLAVFVILNFLTTWLRERLLVDLQTKVDHATTLAFVEHVTSLPFSFHLTRSAGDLLMRLRSNTVVREVLTAGALSAVLDGGFSLLYLGLLLSISPSLTLLVAGFAGLQCLVLVVSTGRVRQSSREVLAAEARCQGYSVELLSGIAAIKSAGAELRAIERFASLFVEELAAVGRRGRLLAVVDAAQSALALAAPLAVLAYGGLLVLDGKLALGTALAVNALAAGLLQPVASLVATGLAFQQLGSYVERLNTVLELPPEPPVGALRQAPRLTGSIEASRLSFAYAASAPPVIQDVNIRIRPGQTLAIVGQSGSGKTTLGHLLIGLLEPSDGCVTHDGLDISEIDRGSLRRQLGVVSQEPFLFASSIRSNIALADPAMGLDAVEDAARLACVHEDIARLPLGYDTVVGKGGGTLSGGQRQRIAVARALAAKPPVLLLDEATSHLDASTEAALYSNLRRLKCTTIVIAHRLSTIASASRVVVMANGRVVEQGSPRRLLARDGAYRDLVSRQLPQTTRGQG